MGSPYAGTMTIGGGVTLSYISTDGNSLVVSATVGGVLNKAARLDPSQSKVILSDQGAPGSGIPSVEVIFASTAQQVTVSWTLSWAGIPNGSTSSGILAGWPAQ